MFRCFFPIVFTFAIITIIIIITAIKCCLTREEVEQKENIAALAIGQAKVSFFYSDDDDDDSDDMMTMVMTMMMMMMGR